MALNDLLISLSSRNIAKDIRESRRKNHLSPMPRASSQITTSGEDRGYQQARPRLRFFFAFVASPVTPFFPSQYDSWSENGFFRNVFLV